MYSQHPKIAKRFEEHTPKGKLPQKMAVMGALKKRVSKVVKYK